MAGDVNDFLSLITSEHNQRPLYVQSVSVSVQAFADLIGTLADLPGDFDLDTAIGVQEDAVGVRVGRSRYLSIPLNIYFSFDTPGLGWDEGVWKGPFDSNTGLTRLFDEPYRILLRATIAANNWDGTIPGAYAAWQQLFVNTGFTVLVQDYGNMSFAVALLSAIPPDVITAALFTTGELDLKPAGMKLWHVLPTVYPAGTGGTPLFGFDVESANVAGWDHGAWGAFSLPE